MPSLHPCSATVEAGRSSRTKRLYYSIVQNDLPRYAIASVDNALQILLLFRDHEALRVTDVSAALGVGRSTAHRLLMTLTNRGFVQQERNSRSYRTGRALMEFALSAAGLSEIRGASHSIMVTLSEKLDETINLLILEGDRVRFVDSVECERAVRVTGRTGTVLPSYATAGGKVLLAALERKQVSALLANGRQRITTATLVNKRDLYEELDDIRKLGYAINRGESLAGLHAAAVAIVTTSGRVVASLAVSVPADRGGVARLRKLVPALVSASRDIGQRL